MNAGLWVLVAVNLILLAERWLTWRVLWARYAERERRADQLFDRLLTLKGVRPLNPAKIEAPAVHRPVLTQDDVDHLEDEIKERMEVAQMMGKPITRGEAELAVWMARGFETPPVH